tara:strand:- start:76 stop:675 length:600 start_codon:yes stop_codon:yes gene_type:complete
MADIIIDGTSVISKSGSTVTLNSGTTIASGVTFPAGHIIRTNHKYILKDHYSSGTKSWQTAETHTNIMTGLTIGNKLRVFFDGFKILAQQGSYAYALFSVYPSGTTDSLTNSTGKKMVATDYINSQSRGYLGTMTIEITVAASAYDCKLYYMTEDSGYSAQLNGPHNDPNGADTRTEQSGSNQTIVTSGASMTCYEIQG